MDSPLDNSPVNTANPARYSPPEGMSPALARVICRGGYDGRAFAAALVNLVASGHVSLEEDADAFHLVRGDAKAAAACKAEAALMAKLFVAGSKVPVAAISYLRLRAAMKAHYRAMKGEMRRYRRKTRRLWLVFGATSFALVVHAVTVMRRPVLGANLDDSNLPVMVLILLIGVVLGWLSQLGGGGEEELQADLSTYREYLRVAEAPRLEPALQVDGALGTVGAEHAYITAFGLPNSALDRFVAALASVSGHAPEHTSLHSLYRRPGKGRKRGWKFDEPSIFWRIW
jgi:hypothetical protein